MPIHTGTAPVLDLPPVSSPITDEGVIYKFQITGTMNSGYPFHFIGNLSYYPGFNFECPVGLYLTSTLGIYEYVIFDRNSIFTVPLGWATGTPINYSINGEMNSSAHWTINITLVHVSGTHTNSITLTAPTSLTPGPTSAHISRINLDNQSGTPTGIAPSWSYWTTGPNPLLRPPSPPVLYSPANGATEVEIDAYLVWLASATADTYRAQLSTDAGFTLPVALDTGSIADLTTGLNSYASGDTEYYWRALASNGAGEGAWSAAWSFHTITAPAKVILTSPLNTAVNVALNSLLRWQSAARAKFYLVNLAKDAAFTNPILIDELGISGLSKAASGKTDLNTLYYWRVRAYNPGGPGPWSDTWSFTTVASVEGDCPYVDNVFTFNATIKSTVGGGYFKIAAGHQDNITAFLCSNDSLTGKTFAVALRTSEGQWFLTTCPRINFGKLYPPEKCRDPFCRALHFLFCGEQGKALSSGSKLDKVSVGYAVTSTATTANVKTLIGNITCENVFGSAFSVWQKVVILSGDDTGNFRRVLGPAE